MAAWRTSFSRNTVSQCDGPWRAPAALIVPTRFLQDVFGRYGMHAGIIPNVVDVGTFEPSSARCRRSSTGAAPGRDPQPRTTVRQRRRIAGVAVVRARFPAARLTIAGSGPDLASLQTLASVGVSDAVRFTGRLETPDMVRLYQSADVVLNPSRADNTPNSVLEALACGVPVVGADVGGVPFLVQHGVTAWLVNPDSPVELAQGVIGVIDDLFFEIVSRGQWTGARP